MTVLRRTTTTRARPMRPLDLQTICDQCGKSRAHGNHISCSKARQAENAHLRGKTA